MARLAPQRPRLIIMMKEPRMGRAKTRLARQIGAPQALRFYRANCAALIRRIAGDPRWQTLLAIDPGRAMTAHNWPAHFARAPQGEGDIGMRMLRMLTMQPAAPSVLIGSDVPGISRGHIAQAFRLLKIYDAVFGPATDGGFWLVGMKPQARLPGVFDHVRWSSGTTLRDTLANLGARKIGFTSMLSDVDDAEDYQCLDAARIRIIPQAA